MKLEICENCCANEFIELDDAYVCAYCNSRYHKEPVKVVTKIQYVEVPVSTPEPVNRRSLKGRKRTNGSPFSCVCFWECSVLTNSMRAKPAGAFSISSPPVFGAWAGLETVLVCCSSRIRIMFHNKNAKKSPVSEETGDLYYLKENCCRNWTTRVLLA